MTPPAPKSKASLAHNAYHCLKQQNDVLQEEGSWQEVLRALCALEAAISQGSSAACGEIAVHFRVSAQQAKRAQLATCAVSSVSILTTDLKTHNHP